MPIKPFLRKKRPSKSTYAFVDSQNLNLGVQRMGWKMDWRKFREYLRDTHDVTHAFLFIGYMSENESLYEHMYELGYLVVLKPTVDVTTTAPEGPAGSPKPEERHIIKGNVDTELVLYAMKELPNYKKAIIVSGDGDFFTLAEYLKGQNKLAAIMTPNWQYSTLLKPFEEQIIRLDQLRHKLAYRDHRKNTRSK